MPERPSPAESESETGSAAPPPAIDYRAPGADKRGEVGSLGAAQAVFDTVAGPNLRLKDNLIQLVSVVGAIVLGIPIAYLFTRELGPALLIGIFGGLVLGIFISGTALGIYRFIKTVKRK